MTSKPKLDEDTALAVVISSVRGRKKKRVGLLTVAECCRYLTNLYRSYTAVAKKVGASAEIVREFDSLLDLPEKVKKLISDGEIGLDTGYRISRDIKYPKRQIEIGRAVADLNAFDARGLIDYAKRNPTLSVEKCRQQVSKSKTITKKLHVFILPLQEEIFGQLKVASKELKTTPEELIRKIVEGWLTKQRAH